MPPRAGLIPKLFNLLIMALLLDWMPSRSVSLTIWQIISFALNTDALVALIAPSSAGGADIRALSVGLTEV
ncbi:hypothetical protein [Yersinia wautersii]|uniref:Uncharacterized protein n=1 Tax=Yersinia wautersii TaxID=1341643 RepID=A0ABM9TG72_9GAMM|nr:hypothetical protein [Yersinia wautersii]CRG50789.1 Uncharacterised protein [Yersinia wautersii]